MCYKYRKTITCTMFTLTIIRWQKTWPFSDHNIDWLALHLKVGSGTDHLFLEIIRSYVDKCDVFSLC